MEKYIRDAVKNSYFVLALSAAGTFVGYILRIFLSRTLPMEDFGLFYAVSAFVGIFILFRYLGLNQALAKYIPEFIIRGEKNNIKTSVATVAAVQIFSTLCFAALIIIFQESIALFVFGSGRATQVLVIMVLSFIPSTFFVIFQSVFQGYQKIRLYAMVDPFRILLTLVFSVLLIPMGVAGIAVAYLIAAIVTTILFVPSFYGLGITKARIERTGEIFSKMMRFGIPVLFGSVGFVMINNIDTTMLTIFKPLSEVAIYQAALPTSQLLLIFSSSLAIVVLPLVSELYTRKKFDEIGRGVTVITTLLVLAITPFVIALVAFPDAIIKLLFGSSFTAASNALQILAVGMVFYSIFAVFQSAIDGIGRPIISTKIIFSMAVSDVILNIFLIPLYGAAGAAFSLFASYVIGVFSASLYLRKNLSVSVSYSRLAKIFFSALFSLTLIISLRNFLDANIYFEFAATLIAGWAVYVGTVFYLRAVTMDDIKFIESKDIRMPKIAKSIIRKVVRNESRSHS